MNSGRVPGLDKHFLNGKVAFPGFNTVRDTWSVTFREQKMKVKELKRLNVGQLVVTKEEDGSLLAKTRADYEMDILDAMLDLADSCGCKRNARPRDNLPALKGVPGAWEKLDGMSHAEQWEKMEIYRKLRNSARKKKLAAEEEKNKPPLDPKEQAKLDKKKELNQKTRERKKMAKQGKQEYEAAKYETTGSLSKDTISVGCSDVQDEPAIPHDASPDTEKETTASESPRSLMETIRVMVEKIYGFDD